MRECPKTVVGRLGAPLSRLSCKHNYYDTQGFIQDFRFGGETQYLGGSGGMFPQDFFVLKTNALRLILGHFLVQIKNVRRCFP